VEGVVFVAEVGFGFEAADVVERQGEGPGAGGLGVHGEVVPVAVKGRKTLLGVADDFLQTDVAAVEVGAEVGGAGEVGGKGDGEGDGVPAVADEVLIEWWLLFNFHAVLPNLYCTATYMVGRMGDCDKCDCLKDDMTCSIG